ncbi:hypothetical protein VST7929_03070 [Vibrio stylophorae]|uniref:(Na+)-NQR maturation NqrM n=1 Tax=Vibrio stylophorae TaxID=659351 RepID=A0ABM8ZXL8_9VIBR|nr:hypothetical protein VST7929_03070 [Vibrio stylophorae]
MLLLITSIIAVTLIAVMVAFAFSIERTPIQGVCRQVQVLKNDHRCQCKSPCPTHRLSIVPQQRHTSVLRVVR